MADTDLNPRRLMPTVKDVLLILLRQSFTVNYNTLKQAKKKTLLK
jgi:hypothetical protein